MFLYFSIFFYILEKIFSERPTKKNKIKHKQKTNEKTKTKKKESPGQPGNSLGAAENSLELAGGALGDLE